MTQDEFAPLIIAELKQVAEECAIQQGEVASLMSRIRALIGLAELYVPQEAARSQQDEAEAIARAALRMDIAIAASRFLTTIEREQQRAVEQKMIDEVPVAANDEVAHAADMEHAEDLEVTLDAPPAEAGPDGDGELVETMVSAVSGEVGQPAEIPDHPGMEPGADASGAESPSVDSEAGSVVKALPADLKGLAVVITGALETMTRDEMAGHIKRLGGIVCGSVQSFVSLVIAGPGAGSKLKDAERHSIPTISEAAFLERYGEPAPVAEDLGDGTSLASPSPDAAAEELAPVFPEADAGLPGAPPRLPYDDVLDLWSTTKKSIELIAIECGLTAREAERAVKRGERLNDSRAFARIKKNSPMLAKIAKAMEEHRPAAPSGFSKPPAPAPIVRKTFRKMITFAETNLGDVSEGIVVINFALNRIIGMRGYWTTTHEIALTIDKLNDGKCYSLDVLAKAGGWSSVDSLKRSMTTIMEHLRDIGVEMTNLPSIGCHIKRIAR